MVALLLTRNKIIGFFYRKILKPILFTTDPEFVHDRFIMLGKFLGKVPFGKSITKLLFYYKSKNNFIELKGIKFPNRVGLAAGFDKNAQLIPILGSVGFGFMEVGSITAKKCAGNPKPRLWRLKETQSLVVYYGLKNNGVDEISQRIKNLLPSDIPVFASLAKTNDQETCDIDSGVEDYFYSYQKILEEKLNISAFVVNISCPNTFGGEPFTDKISFNLLMAKLHSIKKEKPIFIKMGANLTDKELFDILDSCKEYNIDGVICTNLNKDRKTVKIVDKVVPEKGGLSGKAVEKISNEMIRKVRKYMGEEFVIIGCGGVFSYEDYKAKLDAGANLVQLITGMIFQGPQLISDINIKADLNAL